MSKVIAADDEEAVQGTYSIATVLASALHGNVMQFGQENLQPNLMFNEVTAGWWQMQIPLI